MQKRFPFLSLSAYGSGWSANRRIAIVITAVAVLLAIAAIVAVLTGGKNSQQAPDAAASALPTGSPSFSDAAPSPSSGAGSVPAPPQVAEPVAYAKAAAQMLWSYDTRTTTRDQQLAGMRAWMTTKTKYTDWASVSGQVPDPVLWSRMTDQDQYATAAVSEGHYPSAFKEALADDPSAITEAYVFIVTVNGKQTLSWQKGGGGGAEERAVTLAVQCRPNHDCTLSAIAPNVTQ
ncbi:hypothetical protein [Streptomyces sp. NBC_00102]|uniref:hypothetical protein n=1 Tax=Streptomyces sp. NBC_00102 TaxID=2975652 RepID=UPI0022593835|nr:hypothetical protein [Streptomyces sp. NBC_00102]MCX5395624.1 hypothetical protein [Streptomyces sp. NBC_00102]